MISPPDLIVFNSSIFKALIKAYQTQAPLSPPKNIIYHNVSSFSLAALEILSEIPQFLSMFHKPYLMYWSKFPTMDVRPKR